MSAGVHATWDQTLLLRLEARIRCYKGSFLPLSCLRISPDGQLPRHLDDGRSFLVKRERTHRRRTDPAAQTMAATCRDKSCNPFWRPCSHDLSHSLTCLFTSPRGFGICSLEFSHNCNDTQSEQSECISRVCRKVQSTIASLGHETHSSQRPFHTFNYPIETNGAK